MKLSDLVGPHVLDFAGRVDVRHPFDPDANGIAWGMDNKTFFVFEDPNDGYRSCAETPIVLDVPMAHYTRNYMSGLSRAVTGRMVLSGDYGTDCEILELIDDETGHCWLSVGTMNTDDYYPYFVGVWHPYYLEETS
jgi:hypothetical protein